ncbi:MAG: hypothetical protein ACUVTD_03900 [Nitrososphaerales archaeon]
MMGKIITVSTFKIKQYFGSLRSSKASLFIGILTFLGLNSIGFLFGIGLPDTPFWTQPDRLIDILSAFLSIFLALSLTLSLRGGVTAFQAELDFFFTSAIKPRQYILSDLIFQFVVLHVLFSPFIPFIIGLTFRLGKNFMIAFLIALVYEIYVVLTLLTLQSLGALNLVVPYKRTKILTGGIMIALLLPSLSFVNFFPIKYFDLPYPSTFVARAMFHLLEQSTLELSNVYFLGIFVVLAFTFHYFISKKNLFYYIRPTVMLSFGESRPQAQAIRQRRAVETLGPLTTFLALDPMKGSLTNFLIKKHLIRMIRDGSLFLAILFAMYGAVSVIISSFPLDASTRATSGPLFMLTFYSALVPSILAISWNSYERENLWILLTSGGHIVEYFKSFFVALLIAALLLPLGLIIISLPFIGSSFLWLILSAIAIASFSSAFAILTLIIIKMPKEGSISAGYFFIIFLPMTGAYAGALPFLTMLIIAPDYTIQLQLLLAMILISYLATVLIGLLKLIEKKVKSIKI